MLCGWCHDEAEDFDHIVACRLWHRDGITPEAYLADKEAKRQAVLTELQSWTKPKEPVVPEQSTFVITLRHAPGDLIDVIIRLGAYLEERYHDVQIEVAEEG